MWMPTETERLLIEALRKIRNDKEFVLGIIVDLETDEERRMVLDYIEANEGVSAEELVLLSLDIDMNRKKGIQ